MKKQHVILKTNITIYNNLHFVAIFAQGCTPEYMEITQHALRRLSATDHRMNGYSLHCRSMKTIHLHYIISAMDKVYMAIVSKPSGFTLLITEYQTKF